MPLGKILFFYSGIEVLEGIALPEKHLSPEMRTLMRTAQESKDDLVSVLDDIRGLN